MRYYVWFLNADGSQTWLQSFTDSSSAIDFINMQPSGAYTINYGNTGLMEQISEVIIP